MLQNAVVQQREEEGEQVVLAEQEAGEEEEEEEGGMTMVIIWRCQTNVKAMQEVLTSCSLEMEDNLTLHLKK
jgi:hypothetical protein